MIYINFIECSIKVIKIALLKHKLEKEIITTLKRVKGNEIPENVVKAIEWLNFVDKEVLNK